MNVAHSSFLIPRAKWVVGGKYFHSLLFFLFANFVMFRHVLINLIEVCRLKVIQA